ncbi:EF-hand domain-containing protein [uncultured Pseudomonas sp.]|uniref:EF-hand domain-containing protein n=1 Tax=uncultured Pseudomonas sp. TaxID=114707 RepID=UPI0026341A6A|nr:EF-hand domain-containing protein [uncultured Pseudomonas sp.]
MKQVLLAVAVLSAAVLMAGCAADASDKHGHKGGHPPSPERLINELDSNKDGVLSRGEVKGPLADQFAKIDVNHDGVLSLSELQRMPKPKGRP